MNEQQDNQPAPHPSNEHTHEGVQQISIPVSNASNAQAAGASNEYVSEVKNFFSKNLLQIVKDIFTQPIKGTLALFTNAGNESYKHGFILIATTAVFYMLIPYIVAGSDVRSFMGFGTFFKLGLSAALVLVIISALTFGIKAISGKPDFKKELLTGGVCGIPLMLLMVLFSVVILFNKDGMNILDYQSLVNQGIFSGLILLYLVLMLFNIVQQSFKASGTNDALSWYLAPLVICASFYIGAKLAMSFFGPSGSSPFG